MSINSSMGKYNYYLTGALDAYGQAIIETSAAGTIEMDIQILNQSTKDFPLYSSAEYIGLTKELITDNYIIEFKNQKLKVLYVNGFGRYNQVLMEKMK